MFKCVFVKYSKQHDTATSICRVRGNEMLKNSKLQNTVMPEDITVCCWKDHGRSRCIIFNAAGFVIKYGYN